MLPTRIGAVAQCLLRTVAGGNVNNSDHVNVL